MTRKKITALFLAGILVIGVAASAAYALPDCGMGMSAAPMRMEGCGGGSGCCGCEMETSSPLADFEKMSVVSPRGSLEIYFKETNLSKNFFQPADGPHSTDFPEEEPSPPRKLYDLYSDYRV